MRLRAVGIAAHVCLAVVFALARQHVDHHGQCVKVTRVCVILAARGGGPRVRGDGYDDDVREKGVCARGCLKPAHYFDVSRQPSASSLRWIPRLLDAVIFLKQSCTCCVICPIVLMYPKLVFRNVERTIPFEVCARMIHFGDIGVHLVHLSKLPPVGFFSVAIDESARIGNVDPQVKLDGLIW